MKHVQMQSSIRYEQLLSYCFMCKNSCSWIFLNDNFFLIVMKNEYENQIREPHHNQLTGKYFTLCMLISVQIYSDA